MRYHEGELAIQARAGVRDQADRVGRIIGSTVPPAAAAFLLDRTFVVVSTVGEDGGVSASLLTGGAGFARTAGDGVVRLEPDGGHLERVVGDLAACHAVGLLAIDPATRRRMRVNGNAAVRAGSIEIAVREVYSNCPQYIHERHTLARFGALPRVPPRSSLDEAERAFAGSADTFFIASAHPRTGADASHRGGPAGFVRVESGGRLSFPDYPGNNMFNTLGNLTVNPRAGLLFVDFESSRALQVRGEVEIGWNGDERRVTLSVTSVE